MVKPATRRQAVAHLCQTHQVSQRRACQVISVDRSSVRYRSVRPDECDRARPAAGTRRRSPPVRLSTPEQTAMNVRDNLMPPVLLTTIDRRCRFKQINIKGF